MAEQRRYTQQEYNDYLASANRATNQPWYKHYPGLAGAAVVESVTDLAALPGLAYGAAQGTKDYLLSDDPKASWMKEFGEGMYGEQGLKEIQDYKTQRISEYWNELPPDQQTDANYNRIQAAVEGDQSTIDFINTKRDMLSQAGVAGSRAYRDVVGMAPEEQDTYTDEAIKTGLQALIPTRWLGEAGMLASKAANISSRPARIAAQAGLKATELLAPGSASVKGILPNVAVGGAIDVGMRELQSQPNPLYAPFIAEDVRNAQNAQQQDQAQGYSSEAEPVARPFPAPPTPPQSTIPQLYIAPPRQDASTATQPDLPLSQSQSQLTGQGNVSTIGSGQSAIQITETPDPHNGLEVGWKTYTLGVASAAGAIALIARGRVGSGQLGEMVRNVNTPEAAARIMPTATDAAEFRPQLTPWQKTKYNVSNKQAPIKDAALDSLRADNDPNLAATIRDLERKTFEGTTMEINNAVAHSYKTGWVPMLNRKTYSPWQLGQEISALDKTEQELLNGALRLSSQRGEFELGNKSLQQEIADLRLQMRSGTAQGNTNRLAKINQKLSVLNQRQASNAMLTPQMSVRDADSLIASAHANPRTADLIRKFRQIKNDYDEAWVQSGLITRQQMNDYKRANPNRIAIIEDPYKGASGLGRYGQQIKKGMKGRTEKIEPNITEISMYNRRRSPIEGKTHLKDVTETVMKDIENPTSAMDALRKHIADFHQYQRQNDVKRTFGRIMTQSSKWGKWVKEAHASMSVSEYNHGKLPRTISDNPNVFSFTDRGKMYFFETSDPELGIALRLNPSSTLAVLNNSRRLAQQTQTGSLAPWWSFASAIQDIAPGRATKDPRRVFGWIDYGIKRALPNSDAIRQFGGDPSLVPSMMISSLKNVTQEAVRVAGEYVANDLKQQSSFVKMMDGMMGAGWSKSIGESIIRSTNSSILGLMREAGIVGHTMTHEVSSSQLQGFDAIRSYIDDTRFGPIADWYTSSMDSIRNSAKYVFFSRNLAVLKSQYGSIGRIPKHEMDDLIHDTKNLSGNMTRSPGNDTWAKAVSTSSFLQTTMNSTAHIVEAMAQEPLTVGSRIASQVILPKIAWIAGLGSTVPGFYDWYFNDVPIWERQRKQPMLSPLYVLDVFENGPRAPTLDDVIQVGSAPEFIPLTEPAITAFRASGFFGEGPEQTAEPVKEFGEAISSLMSVQVPPLLTALMGGKDFDPLRVITGQMTGRPVVDDPRGQGPNVGMGATSESVDNIKAYVGAVLGTTSKVLMNGLQAFIEEEKQGSGIGQAFEKFVTYSGFAMKESVPDNPLSPLYSTRREYRGSAQRGRNVDRMQRAQKVMDLASVQKRDARRSGFNMPATQDPRALYLMETIKAVTNSGMMNVFEKQRADLNAQILRLDENKDKMNPREYDMLYKALVKDIHNVDDHIEGTLNQLDQRLVGSSGMDLDGAIDYIESSVQPPS
jgi:hypothetical protein